VISCTLHDSRCKFSHISKLSLFRCNKVVYVILYYCPYLSGTDPLEFRKESWNSLYFVFHIDNFRVDCLLCSYNFFSFFVLAYLVGCSV
jgi:hypothetical protein